MIRKKYLFILAVLLALFVQLNSSANDKMLKQLGIASLFNEQDYLYNRDKYYMPISDAAKSYNLDRHLIEAVIICESRWHCNSVSSQRCVGLMQVLGGSKNVATNIRSGASILAKAMAEFDNDMLMAITAYNTGIGGAKKRGKPNAYALKVFKVWFYLNYLNK